MGGQSCVATQQPSQPTTSSAARLQTRPAGNTLMSYWKCAPEQHPENCHVKSIVRPPHVNDSTTDPHHFKYNKPLTAGGVGCERRVCAPAPTTSSTSSRSQQVWVMWGKGKGGRGLSPK